MEEVKLAAAYYLIRASGRSTAEVYEKVRSVSDAARGCYDADDPAVVRLRDAEFAAMMFLDGCFLLQYMVGGGGMPVLQNRMTLSTGPSIQKDIFLLENQIPWLVLQVLWEFMPVDVPMFVAEMQDKFHPAGKAKVVGNRRRSKHWGWGSTSTPMSPDEKGRQHGLNNGRRDGADDYTPPHLLGLLWYTQVESMAARFVGWRKNHYGGFRPWKSINAVELAEIGIRLTPSTKTTRFWDMSFHRSHLFGELSLSPVLLNDMTACWLVNLAALEEAAVSTSASGASGQDESDAYVVSSSASGASGQDESDAYVVSSYLFMLAMLMDREEEVQQMRSNYILDSTLSNKQALRFFKDLADHLRFGNPYLDTMEEISSYRRYVWISIYRFIYKNYRAIAAFLSVAGVLCSILNALYSLNKKP